MGRGLRAACWTAGDDEQWAFAVDVAQAVCFDGAVEVAKSCIQVLGGIGFTYEHDAHLYLRRALSLRALVGVGRHGCRAADRPRVAGVRRRVERRPRRASTSRSATEARATCRADRRPAADERRAALVETGYLTPHWPAPYGLAADPVTQVVIDQELARAGVTRPDLVIAGWAVPTILEHGTDAQRERFVRPSLLGELIWCQLFSEPGAGSDLASLRTRAERVEGGWRLTGQKVWTSVAERADWGICLARTDPDAPQHQGITYFLVDMRSARDRRPAAARDHRRGAVQRGVPRRRVRAGRLRGRPSSATAGGSPAPRSPTSASRWRARGSARASSGRSTWRPTGLRAGRDRRSATPSRWRRCARCSASARRCARSAARDRARSRAWPSCSACAAVRTAAELVVELQGDAVASLAPDADGLQADVWEMLNTRCLSIAGGTTQILRNVVGERILGLPR